MASGRRRTDVFFNVPFDAEYEPLYLALIAGLTGLGLVPRCVLEIPADAGTRLDRILGLIKSCSTSLHDLSRVKGTRGVPRFNMPFEAGLAIAWAKVAGPRSHRWFVLEAKPFRIQKSLSDLNGFDPLIHGGTAAGVLRSLLNAFGRPGTTRRDLDKVLRPLRAVARDMKKKRVVLYSRDGFSSLVVASQQIREQLAKTVVSSTARLRPPGR